MKKSIIYILLLVAVFTTYKFVYKSGRDIVNDKPDFKVTSFEIKNEFSVNQEKTLLKYLNKTIQVSGKITNISSNNVVLDNFISAQLMDTVFVNANNFITIKGRFVGFDDLLQELKIDQCTVIKKQ